MTTVGEQALTIYDMLAEVFGRDRMTTLSGNITNSATSLTLTDTPDRVSDGSIINIQDERILVRSAAGAVLTVFRGLFNTTVNAHSAGELVLIDPRWSLDVIIQQMKREILSWERDLFKVTAANIAFASNTNIVDAGATLGALDIYRVLNVWRADSGGSQYPWKRPRLRVLRDMDTADFTNGKAFMLNDGLTYDPAVTLRVSVASGFSVGTFAWGTDLESTVGLSTPMVDILTWGVGARMLRGRVAARNDGQRQGQSRSAQENPTQDMLAVARDWAATAKDRRREEAERLLDLYPYEFS